MGLQRCSFLKRNGYQQSRWTAAICMDIIVCARLFIRRHSFPDYRRSGRRQRIREVSGMDGCWGLRIGWRKNVSCEEGDIDRRSTNELRFMTVFSRKPSSTWENLKVKLKPYQRYGGNRSGENWAALEQLEQQLKQCGWNTDIPLGSIYLHGYYEERNK